MHSAGKPWWQQATALVSLGAGGAITGFSFTPGAAADVASPTSMPVQLMALEKAAQPAPADDVMLRTAIVNVTNYYLKMAQTKTPAEMEAIIWQHDSVDGVDHGESCAAFASMTLELAAQVVGQQSWVTGGTTYPWPLHKWADVRVDPNPSSLGITSIRQDAEAHNRWHALGDGYQPQPGDWVLFDGHVEVVTKYAHGVLSTVGGDSLPNFSVNAHEYSGPLSAQGVTGFVDNGLLSATTSRTAGGDQGRGATSGHGQTSAAGQGQATADKGGSAAAGGAQAPADGAAQVQTTGAQAEIPGMAAPAAQALTGHVSGAAIPGMPASGSGAGAGSGSRGDGSPQPGQPGGQEPDGAAAGDSTAGSPATDTAHDVTAASAAIPGLSAASRQASSGQATQPYQRHQPAPESTQAHAQNSQEAFISQIAPGAMEAQRKYGIPAAVTIAQAIDESAWGQSTLAAKDHNLFGIKGTGTAGSDTLPTQEYLNGQWVTQNAAFGAYHDIAESIQAHSELLANSGYYAKAMAHRGSPDDFANALTGVYATSPDYGSSLISLMKRYDLYRYDTATASTSQAATQDAGGTAGPSATPQAPASSATPHLAGSGSAPAPAKPTAPAHTARAAPTAAADASAPATARTANPAATPGVSAPAVSQHATTPAPTPPATAQHTANPALAPHAAAPRVTAPAQHAPAATPQSRSTGPAPAAAAPSGSSQTASGQDRAWRGAAGYGSVPNPGASRAAMPSGTAHAGTAHAGTANPAPASGTPSGASIPGIPGAGATSVNGMAYIMPWTHDGPSVRLGPAAHATQAGQTHAGPVEAELTAAYRPMAEAGAGAPGPDRPGRAAAATAGGSRLETAARADAMTGPEATARQHTAGRKGAGSRRDAAPIPAVVAVGRRSKRGTTRKGRKSMPRYEENFPPAVRNAFLTTARTPLMRAEPLYRDVAEETGIPWEVLAACHWMQCEARPGYSPVRGEKLGTVNPDGTVYRTPSAALAQCAVDLADLADAVYGIDLAGPGHLSVRDLAKVFAAFRWGGLLELHHTSAMEFPYSVAGLTAQHTNMRWPKIHDPHTPDKPGSRFRRPFGAVPIVIGLNYPATV